MRPKDCIIKNAALRPPALPVRVRNSLLVNAIDPVLLSNSPETIFIELCV
jgi:hypothetical protein